MAECVGKHACRNESTCQQSNDDTDADDDEDDNDGITHARTWYIVLVYRMQCIQYTTIHNIYCIQYLVHGIVYTIYDIQYTVIVILYMMYSIHDITSQTANIVFALSLPKPEDNVAVDAATQ